jgi:tetratricopeptide (TPR) repeat protein
MIGSVLVNEGSVLSGRGQRDKAMEYYKKALLVNPADADAWYLMGGELYANHDSVMAEQAWRQVIRLQPEHVLRRTDFVHN